LIYDRTTDTVTHTTFKNILEYIPKNTAILLNDTKVIKARIYGQKESGGRVELLLNSPRQNDTFLVYIRGRVKVGTRLTFEGDLHANVLELLDDGSRIVTFFKEDKPLDFTQLIASLEHIGHIPLPPYIKRKEQKSDENDYQTLFATNYGAVAAPTASLHFTPELYRKMLETYTCAKLTLHVGAGTFKPVEAEDLREHTMHQEFYALSPEAKTIIDSHDPILAIGTTVTRTVEYYHRTKEKSGECDLFLHPHNKPQRVDHLLTNFHLPKSTLLMLVASFLGKDKALELYNIAIHKKYRFFSYGDAMLIL
jgi:S-adenosylmethionine:tRNA ribosyltransferase-isomerase